MSLKKNASDRLCHRKAMQGLSMIEVMAALFVLSVGLLGVAGLQSQGIRAGHAATLRSLAVFKSNEMMERMRANSTGVRNTLNVTSYNSDFADDGTNGGCDDSIEGTAARCSAADIARHDIFRWKESLKTAFPNEGEGQIAVNLATTPPTVTITVNWTERGEQMTYISTAQI